MANRNERFVVKLTTEEKRDLNDIAIDLDVPASQFAREAIREKIRKLKSEAANFAAGQRESATIGG